MQSHYNCYTASKICWGLYAVEESKVVGACSLEFANLPNVCMHICIYVYMHMCIYVKFVGACSLKLAHPPNVCVCTYVCKMAGASSLEPCSITQCVNG